MYEQDLHGVGQDVHVWSYEYAQRRKTTPSPGEQLLSFLWLYKVDRS